MSGTLLWLWPSFSRMSLILSNRTAGIYLCCISQVERGSLQGSLKQEPTSGSRMFHGMSGRSIFEVDQA